LKTKVSFWLIPSEEDRGFFQKIIDTLSLEYDAPSFTPHVTIYSGEYTPDESPAELIEKATQEVQTFSLRVDNLLYTDEFTKTLFVQFHSSAPLTKISETLKNSSRNPSNFVLNPHLSLIYKQMSEETKKNLTTSLTLPKSEVFFDEVRAISTPEKIQKREDVESWKVIFIKKLQQM
jgi:2'-5' RNA ligase